MLPANFKNAVSEKTRLKFSDTLWLSVKWITLTCNNIITVSNSGLKLYQRILGVFNWILWKKIDFLKLLYVSPPPPPLKNEKVWGRFFSAQSRGERASSLAYWIMRSVQPRSRSPPAFLGQIIWLINLLRNLFFVKSGFRWNHFHLLVFSLYYVRCEIFSNL